MDEVNQDYQEDEGDYDEEEYDEGEIRPSYSRINWPFTILSALVLQAGALGVLRSNLYLIIGSTVVAAVCASFVTWKETIGDATYTPHPNKYKLFFAFFTVVGIILSCLVAA